MGGDLAQVVVEVPLGGREDTAQVGGPVGAAAADAVEGKCCRGCGEAGLLVLCHKLSQAGRGGLVDSGDGEVAATGMDQTPLVQRGSAAKSQDRGDDSDAYDTGEVPRLVFDAFSDNDVRDAVAWCSVRPHLSSLFSATPARHALSFRNRGGVQL